MPEAAELSSTIAATLVTLTKSRHPDWTVWDWSRTEDFEGAWNSLTPPSATKPIFIVWLSTANDRSVEPVAAHDVLSPLVWAACRGQASPPTVDSDGLVTPPVVVLDLAPNSHKAAREFLEPFAADRIDWVRLMSWPVEAAAMADPFVPRAQPTPRRVAPQTILNLVGMRLRQPAERSDGIDRHAVANLLGPLLLCRNPPASPHRTALRELVQALGMLPKDSTEQGNRDDVAPLELPPGKFRFFLCDDLHRFGWAQFVAETIWRHEPILPSRPVPRIPPVEPVYNRPEYPDESKPCPPWTDSRSDGEREIKVARTPAVFLPIIDRELARRERDFGSGTLSGNDVDSDLAEVLLLDLRLFSGNSAAERTFVGWLLTRIQRDEWLSGTLQHFSTVSADDVLANDTLKTVLLPSLLAVLLPHLPIVIFSSTSRREIIEGLKRFPNIITSFEKPRQFEGSDTDARRATAGRLAEALMIAAWRAYALQLVVEQLLPSKIDDLPLQLLTKPFEAVDVYLDESGEQWSAPKSDPKNVQRSKQPFVVGGLLILHASAADADSLRAVMERWSEPQRRALASKDWYGRNLALSQLTKSIQKCVPRSVLVGISTGLVPDVLTDNPDYAETQTGDFFDANYLDRLHRKMLETLWELVFCVLTPHLSSRSGSALPVGSIACDIRSIPPDAAGTQDLVRAFGYKVLSDGKIATLEQHEPIIIVEHTYRRRPFQDLPRIVRARAFNPHPAAEHEFQAHLNPGPLHLADSYSRAVAIVENPDRINDHQDQLWHEPLRQIGFHVTFEDCLQNWMTCHREASNGSLGSTLSSIGKAVPVCADDHWILRLLVHDTKALLGQAPAITLENELQLFAERLRREHELQLASQPTA